MKLKLEFMILTLFVLAGCTQASQFEAATEQMEYVDQIPDDFVVPEMIWDSMKPKMPDEKMKPIIYSSVRVMFKEKNKNVLKKPLLAYEFSRGGGEIDLATVVGTKAGTFFLGVQLPEFENSLQRKAFFVSQSRQRKVEGEILGSGCQKLFDISSEFFKQVSTEGIKINTTRFRHVSVLGGHLILLAENDKNWLITQVTFFDSTRPDLFCSGFRTAEAEVK